MTLNNPEPFVSGHWSLRERACPVGLFSRLFGGGGAKKAAGPAAKKKKKKEKLPIADIAKRFDLRGRTGQGSMSKVFHAYDKKLGRMVCLKVLDKVKTAKFEERFSNQ